MRNQNDTPLPDDVQDVATRLRDERHVASPLELDELKRRAVTRASRRRSGVALRARLVTSLLVLGLVLSVASAGVIAGGDDSTDQRKSAAVSQYESGVLPDVAVPGRARLVGPSGCVYRNFTARVRGLNIARVVFYVDGRKVKTVRRPDRRGRYRGSYTLRVIPRRYGVGRHRITARVTYKAATKKRPQTFRITFLRCVRRVAPPRFTG